MAKLYPFKYHFMSPDIKPLNEDVWFKSHQELLLQVVNTQDGRDLLCVDKSFDGIKIVSIAKNRITGLLEYEKDRPVLKSEFRGGSKWGNIIRYRWPEFATLAKGLYSHKKSNQCRIRLNDEWLLAATTSTFYPSPSPDPPVDGFVGHGYTPGTGAEWTTLVNAAGTTNSDAAAGAAGVRIIADNVTDKYRTINRSIFLFDISAIPVTDIIQSATKTIVGYGKLDNLSINLDINLYTSNPASDSALVSGDYTTFGSTALSDAISFSSYNTSGDNDFALNAAGLSEVNSVIAGDGMLKLGLKNANYDNADISPTGWVSEALSYFQFYYADQVGTDDDPKVVIVHIQASNLLLMGVG